MKQFQKQILLFSLFIIVFCFLPSLLHAQNVLDQLSGVPDPGGDPDVTVPIDGGLSFLAAAGVAYSVKKIKEFRKKRTENSECK